LEPGGAFGCINANQGRVTSRRLKGTVEIGPLTPVSWNGDSPVAMHASGLRWTTTRALWRFADPDSYVGHD
jgi:hypothetical protein